MTTEKKNTWSLRFILICTLLGAVLSSWIGPKAWVWFYEPPVELGVSCAPAVTWAMNKLLQSQLIGAAFGLIAGVLIVFMALRKKQRQNTQS